MTIQYSVAVNNARLDSIETTIGVSPKIQFFTGAKPANCAAADSGTKIAEGTLPSDWMAAAASASKAKAGTWTITGLAAAGAGSTIGHYRIKDNAGTTCHEQGSVTITGGGGDMTVDNTSIAENQVCTVTGYTKNAGNT